MPLSAKQRDVVGLHTGDGREALEVRTGAGDIAWTAIPDSVVDQFVAENFASPWPNEVGANDMTVNGLSATTIDGNDVVSGDGSSDHGLAEAAGLGGMETFGVAFTIATLGSGDFTSLFGRADSGFDNVEEIRIESSGEVRLELQESNNQIRVDSESAIDDDTLHAVVINKSGDSASDVNFWIDDMADGDSERDVQTSNTYNSENYTNPSIDHAFYARNNDGSVERQTEADVGVFEFNSEQYTEAERQEFVNRRPEVS